MEYFRYLTQRQSRTEWPNMKSMLIQIWRKMLGKLEIKLIQACQDQSTRMEPRLSREEPS